MTSSIRRSAAVAILSTAMTVAAALAGTGASVASPVAAAHATRLTAGFVGDASFNVTIAKGQAATAVGHLVDSSSGQNLLGYVVTLYARTGSTQPWRKIHDIVTNSDGVVAQKVTPNYDAQLQWRFAGTSGHSAINSPILSITIGLPQTLLSSWDSVAPGLASIVVLKGKPSVFEGYLEDSQFHTSIAGAAIELYARGNSTKPWVLSKTLVTDAAGRFAQTITPNYDVQLQWRYDGSNLHRATSGIIQSLVIGIPPTVISITDSATIPKGGPVTLAGHLYTSQGIHDLAGQTLVLYARFGASKPWMKIKSFVTNSEGKVSLQATPNYTVDLEWRYAGSATDAATVSRIITFTVK